MEDGKICSILNDCFKGHRTQEVNNNVEFNQFKDYDRNDAYDIFNWKKMLGGINLKDQPVDLFIGNLLQWGYRDEFIL